MARYMGIDYGARRVGLAIADDDARMARPFSTVEPGQVLPIIEKEGPFAAIVVGLPRSLDGHETAQTIAVRRFAEDHLEKLAADVVFQDEAGTSGVAEERLRESGRKYAREDIDAEAASIILQDYLDTL